MLTLRRRLTAFAHRLRYRVWRLRWVILSVAFALLGLISIRFPLPAILNVLFATVSFVLVGIDYVRHRRTLASTEFQSRDSDDFGDVSEALSTSDRFTSLEFAKGSVLVDRTASAQLRSGNLSAHIRAERFKVPIELRDIGRRYQEEIQVRGVVIFPGPMLGLAAGLGEDVGDGGRTELHMGDYYQHVQSDLLATVDVLQDGTARGDLGRSLFIDRHNRCREFADSWLFNGVGTSTIAFTSDGKLLTVSQSNANVNSPGLLAPAGSGSLEPRDAGGCRDLQLGELVENGAVREMREESGVKPGEVAATYLLGVGRWLDKAARPEFYAVSFLSVDSHELGRRPIDKAERGFVRRLRFDRLTESRETWTSHGLAGLLPRNALATLSVPLAASLALLCEIASNDSDPITQELRSRGILEA